MIREVLAKVEEAGFHPDPYFDYLSLDELLINAIVHGNRQDPSRHVTVRVFGGESRWGYEVADEGKGFDWKGLLEKVKEPLDQGRDSGRGLALVLASGAELYFLDGGKRIVFVRKG